MIVFVTSTSVSHNVLIRALSERKKINASVAVM